MEEYTKNCPPPVELETIKATCINCGSEFEITPSEQKMLLIKGYALPKRCKSCRAKKHMIREIRCIDCGKIFEINELEAEYYEKNNLAIPKRCRNCIEDKKQRNIEMGNILK